MRSRTLLTALSATVAIGAGVIVLAGARGGESVERVDFNVTRTATTPAYDAAIEPASDADVKEWKDCATPLLATYLSRAGAAGAKVMQGYRKVLVDAYRAAPLR